ncbi:MAG TPA: acyl-CoA dehydrogenase family protein [Actinomycetota bacterium]|nr:acyl-CoA dehydrogenase family protein [Actinomycetota bacterium]
MTDLLARAESLAQRFETRAARYDQAAAFPEEDVEDLRAEGFLGLMVPARLGGLDAGFEDYVRVAAALAAGSASTALIFNMHASVTGALAQIPDELATALGAAPSFPETRDDILRRAAEGAMYGVAITERQAGSRLSALTTTYEPDGNGYRIRGTKAFCSGAGHLDAYLMAARRAASEGDPVISYFLVPRDAGVEVERDWDPLGMRATASHAIRVDARVGGEALLGGIEGLVLPLAQAMPQWLVASYAAVYVGLARAAVTNATGYIGSRTVAGERGGLARVPHVRQRVGRADAAVGAAELAVRHAAQLVDLRPGDPETNRAVYRAKLLAGDTAMTVAASMAEACGAGALRRGAALERVFRDARAGALMPPPSDVAGEYLGSSILGVDGEPPW